VLVGVRGAVPVAVGDGSPVGLATSSSPQAPASIASRKAAAMVRIIY
jgi:hypothetical protein